MQLRARELEERMGLPRGLALEVARGRRDLNQVIEQLAIRDRAATISRRHGLDHAMAMQVARGQADLHAVLDSRAMRRHLQRNRDRCILERAAAEGLELLLGLHGHRTISARIPLVERYEFEMQVGSEPPERVHKLQVKFACVAEHGRGLRRAMRWDQSLRSSPLPPVERPQDRFSPKKKVLWRFLADERPVTLTTLEGERFTGRLRWLGLYELGMELKGALPLVVFRHALHRAE